MKTKLILFAVATFLTTQTFAQAIGDIFIDGDLSYKILSLSPSEVGVVGYTVAPSGATSSITLTIPSTATGGTGGSAYSVVAIESSAFSSTSTAGTKLGVVNFPATLRSIGSNAFNASKLLSFTLANPSALTIIGGSAFASTTTLTAVNLSNTSLDFSANPSSIFNNCTGMISFEMKNNTVATLLPRVFLGSCKLLQIADFSGCSNITSIGDNAFRNNYSLTTLILGTDTPPTLSTTSGATSFERVNNPSNETPFPSLTAASRTLKVPTTTGVTNYSTNAAWTSVFGLFKYTTVTARPMIWVKDSEKQAILTEISSNTWKNSYYTSFTNRVNTELNNYMANRAGYLNLLPFNNTNAVAGQIPPFKTIVDGQANASADRATYKTYLQSGIDSGVLYYLTGNVDYAKYSATVFYTFMKAMNQIPLSSSGNFNAGWIYPADHLREARDFGAQMPVLYDFIATYINDGGTAYDFAANSETTIDRLEAETGFKNYIFLAKNRGGIESNWSALESASLACNILALDSKTERDTEILYVINKAASNQIPLSTMSQIIQENGGIWPEPFTYSKYVAEYSTYLMSVITKYDSAYDLANNYINIPLSEEIPNDFSYPNGNRTLHFGDGSRGFARYTDGYEMSYYLGKLTNNSTLLDKFGKLINSSISFGNYQRQTLSATRSTAVEPYFDEPLRLLWFSGTVQGASTVFKQNVTNKLDFAGISMQRNIATPDPVLNGLMCFVGGAGFVHSYASGMNMELYGPKTVIGAAAGNTQNYTSTIHRNYYRLFAAHNTVIVNGASQGDGGNADIDINTVEKLAIEPEYTELPVSLKNSFSTTSFSDDKGTLAEALQYRTMAIVRTSPTTGYYVDVFKSNSSLTNEYHDYVYHNLSDALQLQSNGSNLSLTADATRYANGNISGGFANPGWQYFTDIQTSGVYNGDVTATFTTTGLGGSIGMKMHMPGEEGREYTMVNAPPTLGVATAYNTKDTPTVVVRQNGEAWKTPFAAIYEPYNGANASTVTSVTSIKRNDTFTGLIVLSTVAGKNSKQIILVRDNDNGVFNDATLDVEFTGRFAILSMDENDALTSIYMGKGSRMKYKGWEVTTKDGLASSFYVEISNKNATITTNSELVYTYPSDNVISSYAQINLISTTWNGSTWSNGVPTTEMEAIIAGNYNTATNGIISTKKLTVNSGVLTVNSGNLTVVNELINNADANSVIIENNANLIQGVSMNTNSGNITVKRNSNPLYRLDYTLWSSPVSGAQTLAQFSPLTSQSPISRFYTYNNTLGTVGLYSSVVAPTTTTFATGTGYLIRMPNTDLTTSYDLGTATLIYPGVFTGIPNNGTITLNSLTANKYYAIGNPYPSTISADAFINANITDRTLYFWRKKNAGSGSAYATYNLVGTTVTALASGNGSELSNGTIQVGQGFIVKTGLATTSLAFNNSMRLGTTSTQFFKANQMPQKDRFWLNLSRPATKTDLIDIPEAFSQTLIGYMNGATLGIDNGIDGKYINDSPTALTSRINDEEYVIQGRPAFDVNDVVTLNFKNDALAIYTIALDHFDGVFNTGQDIYLVDSKTGIETNLKTEAYTFTAEAGVDDTRFSLKYQKTLKLSSQEFDDESITIYRNNGSLFVNSRACIISSIKVFDIQGKLISEQKNVNSRVTKISDIKTRQVLIVKITSEDKVEISKKVVN